MAAQLEAAALRHGAIESFATPRRLALRVRRLAAHQPEQTVRRRGPPLRAAFDAAGAPTRAALAFAASCGVELAALGRERDEKDNEYLWYGGTRPGAATVALLPGIISTLLDALPIPKRMRWGNSEVQFVRPVHWLVMLYGTEIVPAKILGLDAGRSTRGHRFHAPRALELRAAAGYEKTLLGRGHVIASSAARGARVRELVLAAAQQAGGQAIIEPALLAEVTALVEWPVAIAGRFEERFLALPREVLLAALQDHQRYFPVATADGALLPWFIAVANIDSLDPAVVRAGNERVVRPRLADAAFFWEQDRRTPLAEQVAALDRVTFQAQLGSVGDKARARRRAGSQPRRRVRRGSRTRGARRAAVQVRSAERHGRRVPRTAGRHGRATTHRPTARTRKPRPRSASTTCRARRAMSCRPRPPARRSRWPTASIRWRESSRSDRSPAARAIPSACAAPPSACCA